MDAPPVQYVKTSDGFSIAYATVGHGEPLVLLPQIFSHIEVYWTQDTFVLPWLQGLAENFQIHQYDGRGQGMSTRGLPDEPAIEDFILDLESVLDRLRLERPVILASHWMSHVAIRFAVANPDRVRALVISACPVNNAAWPWAIYQSLAATDWETFLRSQAALGQARDIPASLQRLRQTVNQDDWGRIVRTFSQSDLTNVLSRLQTPTLVTHPRDFFNLSSAESSNLAASIPNSRFLLTDGQSPPGDTRQNIQAIQAFLADLPVESPGATDHTASRDDDLSGREREVLRLLAAGKSNPQIAEELFITRNTVQNHVSSILIKLNLQNRAQAAVYAQQRGIV